LLSHVSLQTKTLALVESAQIWTTCILPTRLWTFNDNSH